MIPGEIAGPDGPGRDQRRPSGHPARRVRSRTPATGPSRSARTTTSPRPTRRSRSTARRPAGIRLDIPAGTAVRFEPGIAADVDLVPFAGQRDRARAARRVGGPLDG